MRVSFARGGGRCKGGLQYLRSDQLVEVWRDVEEDPIYGSGQSDPTEEQDEQHEVGIGGWEIHHLPDRGWTAA